MVAQNTIVGKLVYDKLSVEDLMQQKKYRNSPWTRGVIDSAETTCLEKRFISIPPATV